LAALIAGLRACSGRLRFLTAASPHKYFHCMANCQAAQKGMGGTAATQCISNGREWFDQNVKGDTAADSAADQVANLLGRSSGQMSPAGNCLQMCGAYRPGESFPY